MSALLSLQSIYSTIQNSLKTIAIWLLMTVVLFAEKSTLVSDWNATAVAVTFRIPNPNRNTLFDLAYMHIAIYDAVNAIDRKYSVFAIDPPNAVPYASEEAAANAAARRVLMTFYSADSIYIDSVYNSRISILPANAARQKGIEIGNLTASMFLASRNGDGREAAVIYSWQTPGPGVYQTTPPGSAQYNPVNTWAGQLRTFSVESAEQFRAPGPPALTSDTYTRDFNEVKMYGSLDQTYTTPEQREIARFHTENPNVQFSRNVRLFAESRKLSLEDNARLFAQIYVSLADAGITGFGSKYHYNYWRPVTAIRSADADGNPATLQDDTWQPLVGTPRHPEYPAAHAFTLTLFAVTLERFFGTSEIPVTLTSTVTSTQHHFTNTNDIITESINARVYGGMHFRTSGEHGAQLGRQVAEWVADHNFQRVHALAKGHISKSSSNPDIDVKVFNLDQNHPNPFNPTTTISFAIPSSELVNLTVYDMLGREVAVLVNSQKDAGSYKVQFDASNLAAGIYIYRLKAGRFEHSRKLLLIK